MDEQPVPPSALVTIDEDAFGPGVDWRTADGMQDSRNASWVLFAEDARAAAEALHRAAPQFYSVDENGAINRRADDDFDELAEYTPNYVSNVRIFDAGAYVYVDTKSMFFPAMARTMMRLIIVEVEKLGVAVRVGDPYAGDYYSRGVDYAEALPPQ